MILEIPEDHVTFQDGAFFFFSVGFSCVFSDRLVILVEAQFKASWRHHDKICPTVRHIYKIVADQTSSEKYDAYR